MTGTLAFVGAGPGDPDLLTRAGRELLRGAEVVVVDRASLDDLLHRHAAGAERVLVGRGAGGSAWPLERVVDLLAGLVAGGRRVVRLKSGDLFVCARTAEETRALEARGVAFTTVPGVSAAVAAPAAAGIPVTRRDCTAAFTVIAGNDDPTYPDIAWDALAAAGGTIVVLMGRAHQRVIAGRLLDAGLAPSTPVAVVHAGTRPSQQVLRGTLAELGHLRLPPPATVVIGAVAALDLRPVDIDALTADLDPWEEVPVHIPDGLIALPVSLAAVAVAAPVVAASTRRAGRQLLDREIPVAGLVVAYLVVSQLLVFPVGLGTSAHLIGAGLALVLVGPAVAITCVSIVLVIQALLLADGGITALGLNALNSGIVPILVGWLVLVVVLRLAGERRRALPVAAGFAAGAGVLAGAAVFCLEYAAGGPDAIPMGQVAAGMVGGHVVIAAVEGVLTALLVAAVLRLRPDLIRRWRPSATHAPELVS